jgi:hypothetical protein
MLFRTDDQDIIVDDLPINNIRKLVARQMSMSIQLVIQVYRLLVLSDGFSLIYTHIYTFAIIQCSM